MVVYVVVNKVNGKVYVGCTVQSLDRYWKQNLYLAMRGSKEKPYLYAAIRKYGAEAFTVEPICTAVSREELFQLERMHIARLHSLTQGYNLTAGGDGRLGHSLSMKSRRKIGDAVRGKTRSAETRERIRTAAKLRVGERNGFYGKQHDPETFARICNKLRGRHHSEETKARMRLARRRRKEQK